MSGTHFHVHGPHDHELEHAAQAAHGEAAHGKFDRFAGRIAVTTAILLSCLRTGGMLPSRLQRLKVDVPAAIDAMNMSLMRPCAISNATRPVNAPAMDRLLE